MTLLQLTGIVKSHTKRGRKLGFPTANINVSAEVPDGIYVGITNLEKEKLPSLIFIGTPEMFGETEKRSEIYILDFDGDIYGEEITVELLKKLRDSKKFVSKEELIEAMKEDERQAREFFK